MISIVIPTFNEAEYLPACLKSIVKQTTQDYEIIVSDGQSTDTTVDIAKNAGCTVVHAAKNRAQQLNAGAAKANGDILFFLHADSIVDNNALSSIQNAIANGLDGGAFNITFDYKHWLMGFVAWRSNFRAKYFKIFFGDQGIFVTKRMFDQLHGFSEVPIMEDLEFSKRLRKTGQSQQVQNTITSSARAYKQYGPWRLTNVYFRLMVAYHGRCNYEEINAIKNILLKK